MPGIPPPDGPADKPGYQCRRNNDDTRRIGKPQANQRAQDGPGHQLSLSTDINNPGAKSNANSQRHQQQRRSADDRVGQSILAAKSTIEQCAISGDGVGPQELEHYRSHPESSQGCQKRQEQIE